MKGLKAEQIRSIVKMILKHSNFLTISAQAWEPIIAIPTGAQISCILANMRLNALEEKFTHKSTNISVYTRYIDDVFCTVNNTQIPELMRNMNSEELQFVSHYPEYNKIYKHIGLNFLDKFIFTSYKDIAYRSYRKPEKGDHVLSFDSA